MDTSGIDLIDAIQSGNHKVFEQVFKQHYPLLCYEARAYSRNNDVVEEIVCDVFTRLWTNRESIQIKTSLRDYLVKSVHNSCIDYYRHQKVRNRLKSEIEEHQRIYSTLADLGEDPLEYIVTRELEEKIDRAIEELPEQYKRAFKLSRFSDLTYEEIAIEMGLSVNSVKTNIKNALAALRRNLSDFFILALIIVTKNSL
jgi:RNA polymerase sigma-70 factor (ECF subfamily)